MSRKSEYKPGEFCGYEIMTSDPEKAKAFYTTLFGWTIKDHNIGLNAVYTAFMQGDEVLAGVLPISINEQITSHWRIYINVENLDASVEKAKSLGANIVKPKTFLGDKGCFAIIQDPTGAHVAVWEWFV